MKDSRRGLSEVRGMGEMRWKRVVRYVLGTLGLMWLLIEGASSLTGLIVDSGPATRAVQPYAVSVLGLIDKIPFRSHSSWWLVATLAALTIFLLAPSGFWQWMRVKTARWRKSQLIRSSPTDHPSAPKAADPPPSEPAPPDAVNELRKIYPKWRRLLVEMHTFISNQVFRGHMPTGYTNSNQTIHILVNLYDICRLTPFYDKFNSLDSLPPTNALKTGQPITEEQFGLFLNAFAETIQEYRELAADLHRLLPALDRERDDSLVSNHHYLSLAENHQNCVERLIEAASVPRLGKLKGVIPGDLPRSA